MKQKKFMDIERLKEKYVDGFQKGDHIVEQVGGQFGKFASGAAMKIVRSLLNT